MRVYDLPVENMDMVKVVDETVGQITEMQLYYKGYCKHCLQGQKGKIN